MVEFIFFSTALFAFHLLFKNEDLKSQQLKTMEQTFTKEQVIAIIDDMLGRPDMVMDAMNNEDTNYVAEDFFFLATYDDSVEGTMERYNAMSKRWAKKDCKAGECEDCGNEMLFRGAFIICPNCDDTTDVMLSKPKPATPEQPTLTEVEQQAEAYAERVCSGQFPVKYTREQSVFYTAADFAAGAKYFQERVISVLKENYEAAKGLTDEDKIRPAQELLLETYEDLIAIFSKSINNGK